MAESVEASRLAQERFTGEVLVALSTSSVLFNSKEREEGELSKAGEEE
jgi:hypothetical protein